MSAILEQLGLNQTFYIQILVFAVFFFLLRFTFFVPFQRLHELRSQKMVHDRERAEKLLLEARLKAEEYEKKISDEFAAAKLEMRNALKQVKSEEQSLLSEARSRARKLTQESSEVITKQKEELKKQLQVDVEGLARGISERLLRKV